MKLRLSAARDGRGCNPGLVCVYGLYALLWRAFTVIGFGSVSFLSLASLVNMASWWPTARSRKLPIIRPSRRRWLCSPSRHRSDGCLLQRPRRSTPPRADTAPPPSPGTASAPRALAVGVAPGGVSRERPDAVPVHIRENNGRIQQTAPMPRQACRLSLLPNVHRWRKGSPPGSHLSVNGRWSMAHGNVEKCNIVESTPSQMWYTSHQSGSPAFGDVRIPRDPDMTAAHGEQHAHVRYTIGALRIHVKSMIKDSAGAEASSWVMLSCPYNDGVFRTFTTRSRLVFSAGDGAA